MGRSLTRRTVPGLWPRARPPSAGTLLSRPGSHGPSPEAGGPSSSSRPRGWGSPVSISETSGARPEGSAPEGPAPAASPSREAPADSPPPSSSPSWPSSRPPPASPEADGPLLRQGAWGGMAAGSLLEAGLARVLFYPTLLYTVVRGTVPGRARRDWYNRIDRTVLLGALPLRSLTHRVSGWGRAPSVPPGGPGACLSPLFTSAAGGGRERARGDHHERGVRDPIPVQLRQGVQLEPRGGCTRHHQDPVTHLYQTWPV
ncbi:phosphatidylglycerophosphatase and protein-tyrosine phosphatase 1 isoform X3 [Myotis myotis]|uniref:phosphatidylglycerophosphatase and protein-tyrosine phosphatase 1 isoform X3 n=1 Tax=Myotis myotis TaxID=51298 RepID=UPI00174CE776|nr:phosphatidylglycerophosphatase and protein-tyrosine phosphatase 1 isoform X3 [Myotis myotis]